MSENYKQGLINALKLLVELNKSYWLDECEGRGAEFSLLIARYGNLIELSDDDILGLIGK